jgi:hypothetical protein
LLLLSRAYIGTNCSIVFLLNTICVSWMPQIADMAHHQLLITQMDG